MVATAHNHSGTICTIPDDLFDRVMFYAPKLGMSENELVCEAVAAYFRSRHVGDPVTNWSYASGRNVTIKNIHKGDNNSQWFSNNNIVLKVLNGLKLVFPDSSWEDVLKAVAIGAVLGGSAVVLLFGSH